MPRHPMIPVFIFISPNDLTGRKIFDLKGHGK